MRVSAEDRTYSRTELDSHASSIVVGDDVLITHDTGRTVNFGPFTEQLGKLRNVTIIDCLVAYDCTYTGKSYYLSMYNVLYIPDMGENLVPPFVIRRQGNIVLGSQMAAIRKRPRNDSLLGFEV